MDSSKNKKLKKAISEALKDLEKRNSEKSTFKMVQCLHFPDASKLQPAIKNVNSSIHEQLSTEKNNTTHSSKNTKTELENKDTNTKSSKSDNKKIIPGQSRKYQKNVNNSTKNDTALKKHVKTKETKSKKSQSKTKQRLNKKSSTRNEQGPHINGSKQEPKNQKLDESSQEYIFEHMSPEEIEHSFLEICKPIKRENKISDSTVDLVDQVCRMQEYLGTEDEDYEMLMEIKQQINK